MISIILIELRIGIAWKQDSLYNLKSDENFLLVVKHLLNSMVKILLYIDPFIQLLLSCAKTCILWAQIYFLHSISVVLHYLYDLFFAN